MPSAETALYERENHACDMPIDCCAESARLSDTGALIGCIDTGPRRARKNAILPRIRFVYVFSMQGKL